MNVLKPKFNATKPVHNPRRRAATIVMDPDVYGALERMAQLESATVDQTVLKAINEYIRSKSK